MTVSINPQDRLPTVTAERCNNVHLYYYEPRALGAVYTVKCSNIFVHLQPPYPTELPLQLPPPDESNDQFMSTYKPQGKQMVSVKVIRGRKWILRSYKILKVSLLLQREGAMSQLKRNWNELNYLRKKVSKVYWSTWFIDIKFCACALPLSLSEATGGGLPE